MKSPLLRVFQRLLGNQRGEASYAKFIGLAIAIVIVTALVPTVYDTISGTNTTGWSTLTGGTGAITLLEIILLIFVAGIVVYLVREILG